MEISGSTALLTGATGGLGRAIAHQLAGRGARLDLSARNDADLEALAGELPGAGHRALAADLEAEGAAETLLEEAGEIDILVANAGLPGGDALENADAAGIARVIRVNLEAPAVMAGLAATRMRRRGSGQIVLISSLAGKLIPAGSALYSATKSGLRALGLGLRNDLAGSGVGVSVIYPGFIRDAGMFHEGGGRAPGWLGTSSPDEVGEAVAEAIEHDKPQIDVAPVPQRGFAQLGVHMPRTLQRLERAMGGSGG